MKKYLNFDFDLKSSDDNKGVIEGYGSVFGNKDFHDDIIEPGAFTKTLKKRLPAMLLQHNMHDVAGVWLEAIEDDKGLLLRGQLNMEVQKAREAYHLAKQGALKGLSIGFYTKSDEVINGVRHIKEIELLEVSLVTFPANDQARVSGVKEQLPKNEREFEATLREMGYGRNEAKAIVAKGFKGFQAMQRDADSLDKDVLREADNIKNLLQTLNTTLKGN